MINHFYDRLMERVVRLSRFKERPYKLAYKLGFWMLRSAVRPAFLDVHYQKPVVQELRTSGKRIKCEYPKIAVYLKGGVGDIVLGGLYVKSLYDKFPKSKITIALGKSQLKIAKILFKNQNFVQDLDLDLYIEHQNFDVVIELDVYFPRVVYKNHYSDFCDEVFSDYVDALEKFHSNFPNITKVERVPDQMLLMELKGLNRINCMDIGGFLGLDYNSLLDIKLDENIEQNIYKKWPFLKDKFITVGRGVDSNNASSDSIRLWSVEKYNDWIKIFKQNYPDVKVVQLGVSKVRCQPLSVDIDLVGQTSFEELLFILKKSLLHLDGECGYVHLRHFLTNAKGKSVVLFGPTSKTIRGYKENINIRNDSACPLHFCEWIAGGNWHSFCLKDNSCRAACIESLSPMYVFKSAQNTIDTILRGI